MASSINFSDVDEQISESAEKVRYLFSSRGKQEKDAKCPRQDSIEGEITQFLSQCCDKKVEDGINCPGCKLLFCLRCAKVSPALYNCLRSGEMGSFHWNCKICGSSFPSLENITGAFKNIQATYEGRMTNKESRMDTFEEKGERLIVDNEQEMRDDIIESIKGEVNQLVDNRSRELDDRKRRELNLTKFNLPEHRNRSGRENKTDDEFDFSCICADLGLSNVSIQTSLRLGKKLDDKKRPLKIILTNKAQQKFILDNAKNIPSKVRSNFNNVIISKVLTPQQREEKRKQIICKREQRGLSQRQGQGTHAKRFDGPINRNPVPNTNTNRPSDLRHEQPQPSGSNSHGNSGGLKSPTFHSTMILRPSSSNSPPGWRWTVISVQSHHPVPCQI